MKKRWHAVDFHVHTPISRCYAVEEWSPARFLATAVAAGLDAVVVTDHHCTDNAMVLREQAPFFGLTILVGVEVTTADGHLLVLLDDPESQARSEKLMRQLGIPSHERGNGSYTVPVSMCDVVHLASSEGALCIPAHIDRWPNGFLERRVDHKVKRQIQEHPEVAAVEITLRNSKSSWEEGKVQPFSRSLTCVQGSDAHALDEIGRRPTWVHSDALSVSSLRSAFRQPANTSFEPPVNDGARAERKCRG